MPDDLFEDAPAKNAPMPDADKGDPADKESDGETFLVNKQAYPDAKPGDMFKMRVVRVHEDEMECSVEKDDEQQEGDDQAPEEAPMPEGGSAPPGMMD